VCRWRASAARSNRRLRDRNLHAGAITPATDINELIRQTEKIQFYEKTNLGLLRPNAWIEFSLQGATESPGTHRRAPLVHGRAAPGTVAYDEAVTSWYEDVYLPMVQVIQDNQISRISTTARWRTCTCGSSSTCGTCGKNTSRTSACRTRPRIMPRLTRSTHGAGCWTCALGVGPVEQGEVEVNDN